MAQFTVVMEDNDIVVKRNDVVLSREDGIDRYTWIGKQDMIYNVISRTVQCMNEGDSISIRLTMPARNDYEDDF